MSIFSAKIKKNKDFNSYDLSLKGLTSGKIAAIVTALEKHDSVVGNDVLILLKREIANTDISL